MAKGLITVEKSMKRKMPRVRKQWMYRREWKKLEKTLAKKQGNEIRCKDKC